MKFRMRRTGVWLMLISFIFVVVCSAGPLSTKVSGNFKGRFALTKSLVDHGEITTERYKRYMGFDQSLHNGKVYSSHNPGLAFLMVVPYALVAKPLSNLLWHDDGMTRERFLVEGWVSRIIVFGLIFSVAMYYFMRITVEHDQLRWATALLLLFGTLIPYYSVSVLADALSALLQFPLIYFLLYPPKNFSYRVWECVLIIFCFVFLFLNKPSNILLAPTFLLCALVYKNIKYLSLALMGLIVFGVVQACYNYSIDKNVFSFALDYFLPNGIYDAERLVNNTERLVVPDPMVGKLYEILLGSKEGLLLFNPALFLLAVVALKSKENLLYLLSPLIGIVFFIFYKDWQGGADLGWRNGLPLIPLLLLVVLKDFHQRYLLTLWGIFTLFMIGRMLLSLFASTWVHPDAIAKGKEFSYLLKEIKNDGGINLLSNTNLSELGPIVVLMAFGLLIYGFKTAFESYSKTPDSDSAVTKAV